MIHLKFEPEVEREFISQYLNKPLYRTGFMVATFLYGIFGILDYYMLPETKEIAWLIRFLIVIPCLIATLILSYLHSFKDFYIPVTFSTLLIGAYGIIFMIFFSKEYEPGFSYYFSGLTIVIYYIGLFSEMRFAHALYLVLFVIIGYFAVTLFKLNILNDFFKNTELPVLVNNSFFLFSAGVISLIATYLIEKFRRQTFYQQRLLSEEKKKSEILLHNILPLEVAEELKQQGSVKARYFNEVSVMFCDFRNFTILSEKLAPEILVSEIDYFFKTFDTIISRYPIEKIKTIGDCYMCAGGLPLANKTNAIDVVSAAINIQQFMHEHLHERINEGKEPFEISIGIHTGPVVAGIAGVKKYAYDIWGDTVNIAARMEQNSETGKINISGRTYELVKENFNCIYRGKIKTKNKGELDMYFVETV